jgi:hypothetical protein
MPNLPISSLPELTAITSNAEFVVEQSGTTYKIKNNVLTPYPTSFGLFSQTGNSVSVSATTVEGTIIGVGAGTLSVPVSGFSVGDSFLVNMGGLISAKNNDTLTIKLKSGSIILSNSGAQVMTTSVNDVFNLQVTFTIRSIGGAGVAEIVTLGVFHSTKQSNGNQIGFAFNTVNNTTFDTTSSNTLDITAQWSSTSADNSIYSDVFILTKIF